MEVQGLGCPSCGGAVPLAEGVATATCPSCGMGLLAQGDRGELTYAVGLRAKREQVLGELSRWWGGVDKAKDLSTVARVTEAFPVFVPVWRVAGRTVGWVLGDEERPQGDRKVLVPVERRVMTTST